MTKLDDVLGRLEKFTGPNGSGFFNARCPACGNALSIKELDGGAVYLRCWGESHDCSRADILAALDGAPAREITPRTAPARDATEYVREIWNASAPSALLTRYLRARGITLTAPDVLRFHPRLWHALTGRTLPAMIAQVQAPDGRPVAIHRTWLRLGITVRKAAIEPNKMALGPLSGGAVRLAPVAAKLGLAEGIESALSFMQLTGIGCWSGCGANIAGVVLPREVREVYLALDGDAAGDEYARRLAPRLAREGRTVRLAQAPRGQDWNDLLQGDCNGKGSRPRRAQAGRKNPRRSARDRTR